MMDTHRVLVNGQFQCGSNEARHGNGWIKAQDSWRGQLEQQAPTFHGRVSERTEDDEVEAAKRRCGMS